MKREIDIRWHVYVDVSILYPSLHNVHVVKLEQILQPIQHSEIR